MSNPDSAAPRLGVVRVAVLALFGATALAGAAWLKWRAFAPVAIHTAAVPAPDRATRAAGAPVANAPVSSAPVANAPVVSAGAAVVVLAPGTAPAPGVPPAPGVAPEIARSASAPTDLPPDGARPVASSAALPAGMPATLADRPPAAVPNADAPPSFDIVRVSPRGDAIAAGRAAPHAQVTLLGNGSVIARSTADDSGQWLAMPAAKLPSGGQELTLMAQAPDQPPRPGEASVLVVVPPPPPAGPAGLASRAPSLDPAASAGVTRAGPVPPAPGSPDISLPSAVAVLIPAVGAPRLLQPPVAEPLTGHGRVGLDIVDYDEHGGIRFAGSGVPGGRVRLYVDDLAIGEAAVDPQGRWALAPAAGASPGDHRVRVDGIGIHGRVVARVELPFQRALLSPQEAMQGRVIVQPRQTLWRIARRSYGQGMRYTVIYAANREQIRDPDRIYPGQVFSIPAAPGGIPATGSNPASGSASRSR